MHYFGSIVSGLMALLVFVIAGLFALWLFFATPFGLLVIGAVLVVILYIWLTKPSKE